MSPAQQAVTDLLSALGINVPEFAHKVVIEADNDSLVTVVIHQTVPDADGTRLHHIRNTYDVTTRRTIAYEEN